MVMDDQDDQDSLWDNALWADRNAEGLVAKLRLLKDLLPDFHRLQSELAAANCEIATLQASVRGKDAKIASLEELLGIWVQKVKTLEADYQKLRDQKEDELW